MGYLGAIVPVSRGDMRNTWFPQRIAEYVTMPQMKTLKLNNVAMERDYNYEIAGPTKEAAIGSDEQRDIPINTQSMTDSELRSSSFFQKAAELAKLTPERSRELVEIFIPPRLDFYRQPIAEERTADEPAPAPDAPQFGGIAGELMAARTKAPKTAREGPQAIYGSVSVSDVLVALRAAMGTNDEASRVVLNEDDVRFVNLPELEGAEAGRVKHIGDFEVEVKIRGAEAVLRTVKVVPQDA